MAENQITGGAFQDLEGNPLSYGFLTLQLSHDESVSSLQIVGGITIRVPLNVEGNVAGTVLVWPNDQLVPAGSFYFVMAFKQDGTQAWLSPQQLTIPSSPSPFNLGTWIPTLPPITPLPATAITLQTNGINNQNQALLNLTAGSGVTLTNIGGQVTISLA